MLTKLFYCFEKSEEIVFPIGRSLKNWKPSDKSEDMEPMGQFLVF